MKHILLLVSLLLAQGLLAKDDQRGRFALKGGVANVSVAWLGPITSATLKFGAGGEYWFNNNVALGVDVGMGGEGYGKIIGTTSQTLVNLKTGNFILDPGLTSTFALDPLGHFRLYGALRLGFPFYSGYPGAISCGPALGTLIAINDWIALDLAASVTVAANFKLNYLATVMSIGSFGFRIFI
jgi:hypothetical protein